MKICLVTSFPPSHGGLSEYGLHLAQELQRNPFVDLTILGDDISSTAGPANELPGYSILRCWSPDRPSSLLRLLSALQRQKPDVVWFNLLFSTFGSKPLNAFAGLMIPLLTRISGQYTHVTLHHLMDTVDLEDLGVRFTGAYRLAGAMATRMLLLANSVSVLMPRYREILFDKYGRDNVHVRAHGILTRCPEYPDFSRRGNPHRILAFGKWGTYKRLELMIDAFGLVRAQLPDVKLVIAGGDHPQVPGYVESVRQKCTAESGIEFTGYVHEDRLADMFQRSSVAVMPYTSSTGCSGVAHLACAYGVPVVCADLEDFQQMAKGEDLAIEFYEAGDAKSLATCLIGVLQSSERLRAMAEQNFSAALRMTMPSIVQKYLRTFELQQRLDALRNVSRFHGLPKWLPSRSLLLRAINRRSSRWADHSAVFRPGEVRMESNSLIKNNRIDLLGNSNGDGRRKLHGAGAADSGADDADGVTNGRTGWDRPRPRGFARNRNQADSDYAEERQTTGDLPPLSRTNKDHPGNSEGKHTDGIDQAAPSSLLSIHGKDGNGGNGQDRTGAARVRGNGSGREGANQETGEIPASEGDRRVEGSRLDDRRDREAS
jgi:glycosyltransferase involved in cell wall biosynthesis